MLIFELKVGMVLDMCCQSNMNWIEKARVEAVAHDWFVVRDDMGRPWFIDYGTWNLWSEQDEETS